MISIKKFVKAAAGLALVSLTVASVSAAVLAPGGRELYPTPDSPLAGGSQLLFSTNVSFASDSFNGSLISSVYQNDGNNTLGGLTFTYQFTLSSGPHSASQLTVTSFKDLLVDPGFLMSGAVPTIAPSLLTRSADGSVIRFGFFDPDVVPGNASALLIARTSSSLWTVSDAALINGQAVNITSLAPLPIPEPGSLSLLAIGLGMLAFFRRQR